MPLAASIQNRAKPSAPRWRSGASKWGLSPFSSAEEEATLVLGEVDEQCGAGGELERRLADEIEVLAGAVAQARDDSVPARGERQAVIDGGVPVALPPGGRHLAPQRELAVDLELHEQHRALARAVERRAHVGRELRQLLGAALAARFLPLGGVYERQAQ